MNGRSLLRLALILASKMLSLMTSKRSFRSRAQTFIAALIGLYAAVILLLTIPPIQTQ